MSNEIKTYKDLMEEKQRLQNLLILQKEKLNTNVAAFKTEIKPVISIFNFLKHITSRDKGNYLINSAVDLGTDLISKTGLLKKISWPLRLALPFLVKNVSSNFLSKKKDEATDKK